MVIFMEKLDLKEKKQIVFDILCDIDDICKKHNITYYLAYGTLIGAVRHKAFIPWDDDIDIWVRAEDYRKLLEVLQAESKYQLLDNLKSSAWPRLFSKLSDPNTSVVNRNADKMTLSRGIAVDIFPLAKVTDYARLTVLMRKAKRRIYALYKCSIKYVEKSSLKNVQNKLIDLWLRMSNRAQLSYWQNKFFMYELGDENGRKLAWVDSVYGSRDVHDLSDFESTVEVEFEHRLFPAPKGYDIILRRIYGDYMKLPPEENRISNHDVEVYRINKESMNRKQ